MFRRFSLFSKMLVFLALIIAISTIGYYMMLNHMHQNQLRNEARTVAEHVVAFRSWVARYGVVWVKDVKTEFLGQQDCSSTTTFFSKNPALATRELEHIANIDSHTNFRVTSDNYRNPKNIPDKFENSAIQWFKTNKSHKERYALVGDTYRYAAPLLIKKGCLKCHSDPAIAPKDVIDKYGDKRGFGYKLGEVRGIISVSIPTEGVFWDSLMGVAVWQILLLLLILVVAFIFTQKVFAQPLHNLTEAVEKISLGGKEDLNTGDIPSNTANEIDKVTMAVDRLQLSMQLALKRLRKKNKPE